MNTIGFMIGWWLTIGQNVALWHGPEGDTEVSKCSLKIGVMKSAWTITFLQYQRLQADHRATLESRLVLCQVPGTLLPWCKIAPGTIWQYHCTRVRENWAPKWHPVVPIHRNDGNDSDITAISTKRSLQTLKAYPLTERPRFVNLSTQAHTHV